MLAPDRLLFGFAYNDDGLPAVPFPVPNRHAPFIIYPPRFSCQTTHMKIATGYLNAICSVELALRVDVIEIGIPSSR